MSEGTKIGEGTVEHRCSFGSAAAGLTGMTLRAVYHVADLDGAVMVAGTPDPNGEALDLAVVKLIMGSLDDDDLNAVKREADRLLEGGAL